MMRARFALLLVLAPLATVAADTVTLTDVPDEYPFAAEIRMLQDRDIVRGNPDGTYGPGKTINRAELLTLLYRATGRAPGSPKNACFKDVARESWYEAVVCDASTRGFIAGYPDGAFRPAKEVNRVEALKMIHTVFGFANPAQPFSELTDMYEDIDVSAWYGPYLTGAFARGVIPITGQEGPMFEPGRVLSRGEAAAYISNALGLEPFSSASSSAQSFSEASSESENGFSEASSKAGSSASRVPSTQSQDVTFPFDDEGSFMAKEKHVYRFTLQKNTVTRFMTTVDPNGGKSGLSCRLYKLTEKTSFASEYYMGHVAGNVCTVLAAIGKGEYQFEIQPREAGASFVLAADAAQGDGNDGFNEAADLQLGKTYGDEIATDDIADWYTFTLTRGQTMKVGIENGDGVTCYIYPMEDVDLYGFSGPQCNATYEYPRGTYYVGVQRKDGRKATESYAVRAQ